MRIILLYILLSLTLTASAGNDKLSQKQFKKDMVTVKTNLKKDKELEKSESLLRKYIVDSAFVENKSLHLMLIECLRKQYDVGNEKMYLKEKIDTANIFRINLKQFWAVEAFDSLDAKPNGKGVSEPSYRKKHAEALKPFWGNLLKGGIYFYAHSNWKEAWQCFDTYLGCLSHPVFKDEKLDSAQHHFAAFLAVMSACELSETNLALKYADEATVYVPRKEMTLQRLADLCAEKGDTIHYLEYLNEGNKAFPYSSYFFPNLIDFYTKRKDYSQALKYADTALEKDSLDVTFLLARHNVLMMLQRYDEALEDGIAILVINDSLAIPNYNVACIYYKKAQDAMKQAGVTYKQRLKNAQQYYRLCLPYMERYRKLMPQDTRLWYPVLYDTYLNLNMGKEFDSLPSL